MNKNGVDFCIQTKLGSYALAFLLGFFMSDFSTFIGSRTVEFLVVIFFGLLIPFIFDFHVYRSLGLLFFCGVAWISENVMTMADNTDNQKVFLPRFFLCFLLAFLASLFLRRVFVSIPKLNRQSFYALAFVNSLIFSASLLLFLLIRKAATYFDLPNLNPACLLILSIIFTFFIAWYFIRSTLELLSMPILKTMYRIKSKQSHHYPHTGPMIIISNHAGLFDPAIVEHEFPRPVTGFMTANFFDRWYLKPFSKYIVKAIRVEEAAFRREAPELTEVVNALDRGECVLIFPEGWLRRKEDEPLRRFGQGIWRILKDRPDTPILFCWIEGTWGSYFSYRHGPIGKNKRFDWRRKVDVTFGEPISLPDEILQDQMKTRFYLMEQLLKLQPDK